MPRKPAENWIETIATVENLDLRNVADLGFLSLSGIDRDCHRMGAKCITDQRIAMIIRLHLPFGLQPQIDDYGVWLLRPKDLLSFSH